MDFIKDLNIDKIRNAAEDAYNQAKPKSDVEARVYEVLSHKNWGSSSTILNEIAQDTYDYEKFSVITKIMWESMENQRPAAWRVVFKGLTLLEHLIKNGSERCVDDARNHSHTLRALHQFNYYEGTIDRGLGVREKSKQLVEILGDDERIREERTKARQLREKFGGNAGGVGGGGGSRYAGYGNDDSGWSGRGGGGGGGGYGDDSGWNSGGGGGGYGDGGIPSSGGGYGGDGGGGYSGRYSDGHDASSPTAASSSAPTFATLPEAPPSKKSGKSKTKKSKKKKKSQPSQEEEPPAAAPAEPAVDLFSFDAPPAPAPTAPEDDGFDAFQSATPAAPASANTGGANVAQQQAASFDAFGTNAGQQPSAAPQQNAQFDAFGAQSNNQNMGSMNNMFGNMSMQQNPAMMSSGGNMMGMPQQQSMGGSTVENGVAGSTQSAAPAADTGDEFGDFEDAAPTKEKTVTSSSDPLSRLIQLDSLEKNKKPDNKLNEPIVVNPAAAQFVQNQQQQSGVSGNKSASAEMTFKGIDGLNSTPTNLGVKSPASNRQSGQPIFASGGTTSGNANVIGMLSPDVMMNNQRQQSQQPSGNMMQPQQGQQMPQQGQYGMNQMGQGMNNMQGGMMGQGMMHGNMQGNMMGQGMNNMQGGMNNMQGSGNMQGGMMGQGMNNMQGGGMMMGQGMNNMQGGMMGQGMNNMQGGVNMQGGMMNSGQMGMMGGQAGSGTGTQMGGQNMAGWR